LRHRELKDIYNGAIEPILIYGAPVWGKLNKTKPLDKISASAKKDEYQNSQGIQNPVI